LRRWLPFAEDLVAAYFCAFDRDTPRHVQVARHIGPQHREAARRSRRPL
jgi:hypothetical protein